MLSHPVLEFWYSPLLKLEVTLKPTREKRNPELEFYETYFGAAVCFGDLNEIFRLGEKEALRNGIAVMDAMHIAAANLCRCEYLFTSEEPTRPIFRTQLVKVVGVTTAKSLRLLD